MYFRIVLLLSATAVSGCGLVPPAVSLASVAADAFSYAVSGKSVSDHGLSMVMREDCAVLNFLEGEAVCAPGPHPQIQMVTPRDSEMKRTLVASAREPAAAADRKSPGWTTPEFLPVQFAVAGPLLDEPVPPVATVSLQPVAAGPFGILASSPSPPGRSTSSPARRRTSRPSDPGKSEA